MHRLRRWSDPSIDVSATAPRKRVSPILSGDSVGDLPYLDQGAPPGASGPIWCGLVYQPRSTKSRGTLRSLDRRCSHSSTWGSTSFQAFSSGNHSCSQQHVACDQAHQGCPPLSRSLRLVRVRSQLSIRNPSQVRSQSCSQQAPPALASTPSTEGHNLPAQRIDPREPELGRGDAVCQAARPADVPSRAHTIASRDRMARVPSPLPAATWFAA